MFKNKPEPTEQDLEKLDEQIQEQKECQFCKNQKEEIKKCAEKHKVKNNLKSVTWHILRCSDCRGRVQLMAKCKQNQHRS